MHPPPKQLSEQSLAAAQVVVHGPPVTGHARLHLPPLGQEHDAPVHAPTPPDDEESVPPLVPPSLAGVPVPSVKSYVHTGIIATDPSRPSVVSRPTRRGKRIEAQQHPTCRPAHANPKARTIAGVKLPRLPRRKVLKAAIAFGVLGAAGSVVAVVRSRGYEVPENVRSKLVGLEAWQYVVIQHLARRVCAADEPGVVTPDEADVSGFVDGYVARMAPRMRRDLGRFLGVVEQLAPAGLGLTSRFTRLEASDQDRVLASLESSPSDLLRGGFEGLKALLFMGYYRDARTWSVIGYDGPRVEARP